MTRSTMTLAPPQEQHPTRTITRRPRAILTVTLISAIAACSSAPAPAPDLYRSTTAPATGRPDDLTAALTTAQRLHGLAVLTDQSDDKANTRTLTLIDNLDHRVTIVASAQEAADPYSPTAYTLTVSYGLWGDPEKENAIIQTLQRRLQALAQRRHRRHR